MTKSSRRIAWAAATATYCLIVLGAVVRITGSGLGCGNDWPVCHGRLFPSFADLNTLIEWNHRLVATIVATLVAVLAGVTWWERRGAVSGERSKPSRAGYVAFGLLLLQVMLGAVTVKLDLPPWTVVLHLGTAMLLLATLLAAAVRPSPANPPTPPGARPGLVAAAWTFITVLFGGLTANLGAATACVGFPLCNGQMVPSGNSLQYVQWTHRLLAYGLFVYLAVWAWRGGRRGPVLVFGLALLQVGIAAAMVLLTVPRGLQVAHAAVGAAVWAGVVLVALRSEAPALPGPR